MKENTPKFPSSELWYWAAFSRYVGLIWVIKNFVIKQFITAIHSKISQWWKLYSDQTRIKSLFKTNEKYRYGLPKTLSKHLKMLLISKIIRICGGESSLNRVSKSFFVFPSSHRHLYFVVEVLMVFTNVKARIQWSIACSIFTSFLSAEIVACDV